MLCTEKLKDKKSLETIKAKVLSLSQKKFNYFANIPDRYWILSLLLPDHRAKILDIGPNVLLFQELLELKKKSLYEYYSMDIVSRYNDNWANETVHDANVDPFPFSDNSFELIFASDVIEHIQHADVFLSNIFRVLKTDGEFFLTTPNYASIYSMIKVIQGRMFHNPLGQEIDQYCFIEHVKYFTHKDLIPYLESFGLYTKFIISHGLYTLIPASMNTTIKRFLLTLFYNNLTRIHYRFSPDIILIVGKKKVQTKTIYI